jgi:hypothetical protein
MYWSMIGTDRVAETDSRTTWGDQHSSQH